MRLFRHADVLFLCLCLGLASGTGFFIGVDLWLIIDPMAQNDWMGHIFMSVLGYFGAGAGVAIFYIGKDAFARLAGGRSRRGLEADYDDRGHSSSDQSL